MRKYRVMVTREDWITVTVEADSEACAKRMVEEMDSHELLRLDEQGDGDFRIDNVDDVTEEVAHDTQTIQRS